MNIYGLQQPIRCQSKCKGDYMKKRACKDENIIQQNTILKNNDYHQANILWLTLSYHQPSKYYLSHRVTMKVPIPNTKGKSIDYNLYKKSKPRAMKRIIFEQEVTSDHLLLLRQLQSPYVLKRESSIRRFDFPNSNLNSLDEKPQLYMSVISHFQSIKKWIDKVPKEQLNEIFTIRSEENIEMIINKITEKQREINFEFLIREAQQQENQHALDLSKFRIAWVSNPIVYIDPSQALQCFQTMIYDYLNHYQQFEQILKKKDISLQKPKPHDDLGLYNEDEYDYSEDSEPKVSLKNIIVHCLIKQIMDVYETNKIFQALKEANQIKEFALKILRSSEEYIRMMFEMAINQAIVENSFTKYKVAGRNVEKLYLQYMEERILALLDEDDKMKPAKKKKKNKKVEQKVEGEEKVEEPAKVELHPQKIDENKKETNEEEEAVEKKKKNKKEKTKHIEKADLKEQQTQKQQTNKEKNQNNIESILKNEPTTQEQKPDNQKKKKAKKSQTFTIQKASKCVMNVLNTELCRKMQEINSENKNSIEQKSKALEMVFYHISQHYPSLKISMFGSLSTSTALPTSDIDLVIFSDRKQEKQDFFDELTDSFLSKPWATSCIFIHSAKVPVIKLIVDSSIQHNNSSSYKLFPPSQQQDLSFLVKFDISFHSNNDIANSGIISTCYMSNFMNNQPNIRELYILLKYIFVSAKLNQMYKGGFSSYCLFIMMIAMVQEKKIIVEQITLAQFLIAFLQFFAREFKPNKSILRFVKNYPSVISSQEYDIYFQSHNKLPSTLKFKLVDPITGNFISASFSKYEQMVDLFERCMQNIQQLTHLALKIGESAVLGKEKNFSKFVEEQLAKAEEMASFCMIIP